MKPQMRRILAYVIARLVATTESNTLYDYQEGSYFNFNGEFKDNNIRILDYSDSTYLKGTKSGDTELRLSLVYFADGTHIEAVINQEKDGIATFTGRGIGQSVKFHGTAEKSGKVSFYDSSTGMYYRLKI